MYRHLATITVLALVLVACLFWPFVPGEYDGLAATLSTMALLFGYSGLILVLVGMGWLVYEFGKGRATDAAAGTSRIEYNFAIAAVVCSLPVAAMVTIGALVTAGASAAVIVVVALTAYFVWRIVPRLRQLRSGAQDCFNPAPLYLVALPLVVLAALYAFAGPAEEFSRVLAMENAAPLIRDIEAYHDRHGRFPVSLLSEVEDYHPGLRGIPRFLYEPSGEAYNLAFEQFTLTFGTRQFVAYNPRDEQEFTAHNIDLLQLEPAEIRRGYHAVESAGKPHWKIFFFD